MKTGFLKIFSASCAVLFGLALVPMKASAVNISIGVGGEVLPGVYGTVNIDNGYYPALVYAEPLIVTRPSRILAPVYLHVPPGHLKKWGRYCGRYGACSRPVYFVKSRDYYDFSPRYIEPRYIYRDRITYVDRGGHGDHRHHYYGDREHKRHYDRKEHHRDHGGKHWKHEDRGHGGGHGKHGRGKDKDD